jgi:hypothetical protein
MALMVTGDPLRATSFGNLVAGITIMKKRHRDSVPH